MSWCDIQHGRYYNWSSDTYKWDWVTWPFDALPWLHSSVSCRWNHWSNKNNERHSWRWEKTLHQETLMTEFFYVWVFFHKHSRFTGQQGKREDIYLTPHYHFHLLHRRLHIGRAITAENSPLHIASSRTRTGNLWFPSASR